MKKGKELQNRARIRPVVGISAGDPAGIGPEISAKALALKEIYEVCRPFVVCDLKVINEAIGFSGLSLKTRRIQSLSHATFEAGTIDVFDIENVDMRSLEHKKVNAMCGKASYEYVRKIIKLAMEGQIDATVTGPIHKGALYAAGLRHTGHTEIFAEITGTLDYTMMLAEGDFRVVHVSTHLPLREACDYVKRERIERVIGLAGQALKKMGVKEPRIAVAGLNPHAGEGGLFGQEEIREISPAVEEMRRQGLKVEGPVPADTVFSKMLGGSYDVVVVMYHDQGHIPTKIKGFQYDGETNSWSSMAGVNVTLGLPIVRTSVDHGVAFGKAGEGRANPESMIQAIFTALRLI